MNKENFASELAKAQNVKTLLIKKSRQKLMGGKAQKEIVRLRFLRLISEIIRHTFRYNIKNMFIFLRIA